MSVSEFWHLQIMFQFRIMNVYIHQNVLYCTFIYALEMTKKNSNENFSFDFHEKEKHNLPLIYLLAGWFLWSNLLNIVLVDIYPYMYFDVTLE